MNTRVATRPLDGGAVKAANKDFYTRHPEMVQGGQPVPIDPNKPSHAPYRREWMNSYAANGGQVSPVQGREVRAAAAAARAGFGPQPPGSVALCPQPAGQPAVQALLSPPPDPKPKAGKQPSDPPAVVCEFVSATVTCGHGRPAGPERILEVVPDSAAALGDAITANLKLKGGCGRHPAWSLSGASSGEGRGPSTTFKARTAMASVRGFFALKHVTPQRYQLQLDACGGGPRMYEVRAYPAGTVAAKFDPNKVLDPIRNALKILPVPEEKLNEWQKQWFRGSIEYSGAWKEDKSWKAYYEMAIAGGFDPLFGVSYKGPIHPLTLVPGFLSRWFKAGVFYEVKFGARLRGAYKGSYWPCEGRTERREWSVSGGGGGSGALSLELKLARSEVVDGAISGETAIGVEVERAWGDDPNVQVAIKWDGIKGKASVKAAYGWVEWSRDFQILKEREIYRDQWSLAG